MRKLLVILFSVFTFFFVSSFIKSNNVYAQACTGDSGAPGTCTAPMACTPANIDGQGSCTDPLKICCLSGLPGDGGSGQCSDVCSTSADCADSPVNLQCPNGVCSDINACPTCIGNSGWAGTCLAGADCSSAGKNANDGAGGCLGGNICCTNAPSGTCTLTAIPPFLVGAVFQVNLSSTTPNTPYNITSSPVCGGATNATTDSSGNASVTKNCGPPAGTYTITAEAQAGAITCSVNVNVLNAPGPACIGASGVPGFCVVMFCPLGFIPDGGYPNECTVDPQQLCCVPLPPGTGGVPENPLGRGGCPPTSLYTAIGCIPITEKNAFAGFLLSWGIGIAGGIAIILIIYAAYMVITSGGNPQRLAAGKELLTSAVMGLILLLFGAFILNFIGVQILKIPGFGA